MKVLIAEDEVLAAERLEILLKQYDKDIEIVASIDSVEEVVEFLKNNPYPDLLLLDIQLSDGNSLEIFEQIQPATPVIFVTAYDEYALESFKFNSVDYLLKPISFLDLSQSLDKFKMIQEHHLKAAPDFSVLLKIFKENEQTYKSRFLVKYGNKMQYQSITDIAYFYTDDKAVFLTTIHNKRFTMEFTLENLEALLDPTLFFRINRKFIVKIDSVKELKNHLNSRLKLILEPAPTTEVIVSREKVKAFKQWLDR